MSPDGSTRPDSSRLHYTVTALNTVDSTQSEVQRRAAAGAPEGTVVTALHQRAGRGRRGHDWGGAPGEALPCSVLPRPHRQPAAAPPPPPVGGVPGPEAVAPSPR